MNYLLPIFSILFAVRGLLQTIKTPLRMLIMASGLYRETRIQATLETSIAILGGIVLAPIWGLPGILIGSIIADLYRCIHLMIFVPRKITYENVSVYVWRIVRIILVIGIVFSLSKCVNYDPSNYVNWTIFSFVVGLITVAFVAIIGLIFEKESFNETIKRLRLIPSLFKRSS
ncbi:hypothetical protein [Cohnella rhizosphaerae]|uniref:Polysaccharide biosynthesis protein C-terminal domain-containing protein n=1 Tax=Cohnella rhizosphaerae TaxID=1457232 RepID=A0A9X4QVU8_9BACL|nr:hypothetical protein [Cohnella rhizosphaerae]MDG0811842.1 hypothetical protein [Cohnella rhizosphaerae]